MKQKSLLCLLLLCLIVGRSQAAITGVNITCINKTTTLTGTSSSWSASPSGIVTITPLTSNRAEILGGSTPGTVTISNNGDTYVVNVVALPSITASSATVCSGSSVTLTGTPTTTTSFRDATGVTVWKRSPTTAGSGSIFFLPGGGLGDAVYTSGTNLTTVTITYSVAPGCGTTTTVDVIATPTVTPTAGSICPGTSTTLSPNPTGGTWASANTSIATVNSSGVVTGQSWDDPTPGIGGTATTTTTITYTAPNGCTKTSSITVKPTAAKWKIGSVIVDEMTVCVGGRLVGSPDGQPGSMASANDAVAHWNTPTNGILEGISVGSTTVTFTSGSGCTRVLPVTVNQEVSAITGTTTFCVGSTTTLSDPDAGGTWSSGNTGVATVSSSGVVTGVAAGTARITYSVASPVAVNCIATAVVTVEAPASAGTITGPGTVCVGSVITLSNTATGGVWSSSDATKATVSGGVVTGVAAGSPTISYSVTNSCGTAVATTAVEVSLCCLVNSLVINTGYDAFTGTKITGLNEDRTTAPIDRRWLMTSLSGDAATAIYSQGYDQVVEGEASDVIDEDLPGYPSGSWATNANSNWITAHNAHGYETAGESTVLTMQMSRTFYLCTADDIVFDLHIAADNYITDMNIDGTTPLTIPGDLGVYNDADNFGSFTAFNTTKSLSAGPHTLNITVRNWNVPETTIYNPTGLNVYGNVHSLTSVNSLMAETSVCSGYVCPESSPRGIGNSPTNEASSNALALYPNPNNGDFVLNGAIEGVNNSDATIAVIDVTGKTVYSDAMPINNGQVNKTISLGRHVVNGTYMLRITSGKANYMKRFTIAR